MHCLLNPAVIPEYFDASEEAKSSSADDVKAEQGRAKDCSDEEKKNCDDSESLEAAILSPESDNLAEALPAGEKLGEKEESIATGAANLITEQVKERKTLECIVSTPETEQDKENDEKKCHKSLPRVDLSDQISINYHLATDSPDGGYQNIDCTTSMENSGSFILNYAKDMETITNNNVSNSSPDDPNVSFQSLLADCQLLGLHANHPSGEFPYLSQNQLFLTPLFMKSTKEHYIQPIYDSQRDQVILPVECGLNQALMYLSRLCQGSKGACIFFRNYYWLTPNEFQYLSGRESAKDWKRSIRHNGKSIKLLINKGILTVHSPLCECGTNSSCWKICPPSISQEASAFPDESAYSLPHPTSFPYKKTRGRRATDSDGKRDKKICKYDTTQPFQAPEDKVTRGLKQIGNRSNGRLCQEKRRRFVRTDETVASRGNENCFVEKNHLMESTSIQSLVCDDHEGNYDDDDEAPSTPTSSMSSSRSSQGTTTAENQLEDSSDHGKSKSVNVTSNNNNNSSSPTEKSPEVMSHTKSKRKPNTKQVVQVKSERQSPTQLSSSTSPPMTPPPVSSAGGHLTSNSPPPIKQMEQMMSSNARNYSDIMRSLAAKYNQQPNSNTEASPTSNFGLDTRFLKPAAAAALLNLGSSDFSGQKFPMLDMNSTQALLSMVRSASAAAAAAAASGNLESYTAPGKPSGLKRPNSPLDLSSREQGSVPPSSKKSKISKASEMLMKSPMLNCLSACYAGCSEEAQKIIRWNVDDVCRFVSSIELCKEYVDAFREQCIDGSSLPLLTEEHLMSTMNMKLGPALKFRSTVSKKLGNCAVCSHCMHCHNHSSNNNNVP